MTYKIGFALTGSFCTVNKALLALRGLVELGHDVTAIISQSIATTDTRFTNAAELRVKLEELTGKSVIASVKEAEPIGPNKSFDIVIVAPATGNTVAKIAHGITDTGVTMAVKAHLRNERPVLLAVATNDGLGATAVNLGTLLNRRYVYFVPFAQDDPYVKPRSVISDFNLIERAMTSALKGEQLQQILLRND